MHKILFKIGSFEIYSYSVFIMIAVLTSLWVQIRSAKKHNIPQELLWDLSIYLVATGALGARILYVLTKWSDYAQTPLEVFNFRAGGLSLHGALIGGALGLIWFAKCRNISPIVLLDLISPSVALGIAIGRIGCFLNGCCIGTATSLPWAVGGRHPAQLYEMFLDLILFFILLWFQKRSQTLNGKTTLLFFAGYSTIRFLIEFVREDLIIFTWFSLAQWASIITVIIAIIMWQNINKKQNNNKPQSF